MAASLLAGIRVLDLSQYIPGPYATLMLSDLGADVVKVEPPVGDPMRAYGAEGGGVSPFYAVMNGGKRVISLNLKTREGKSALLDLLAVADVLVESYRPGVLERLGLGRAVLENANPRLVHCSISSYGKNGPLAEMGAHDLNCMALGGGLSVSGTTARPVMTTPPVADYASALQASLTVAAALLARQRTGKGCYIDLSMTDTVLAWQSWVITDSLRGGSIARRGTGESNGGLASYNLYETSDGRFISIGADEDKFWARFCTAVGRQDWIARKSEPAPQTALIDEVQRLIGTRPLSAWNALLGEVDCCFQPVLNPGELPQHPQVVARKMLAPSGTGGGAIEALYPAWIDGRPPDARPAYRDTDAASIRQSWSGAAAHAG
ncbi:MAG TPA: CoA transferase [Dongiaceae bacterium]|jgi:crotonobetainyl-CoA:carnitine CoA-transferase CaiB-like acyl-CoA transferase|nr:CoA transferase [Dongiaceae bacterium]